MSVFYRHHHDQTSGIERRLIVAMVFMLLSIGIMSAPAYAQKNPSIDEPGVSDVLDNAINVTGVSQAKNANTKGGVIFLGPKSETAKQSVKPMKDPNKAKVEQANKAKKTGEYIARDVNENNLGNFYNKTYSATTLSMPSINLKNINFYPDEPQGLAIQAEVNFPLF